MTALAILTTLLIWAFLWVLVLGLMLIRKPLMSARRRLEQIAWGVRAIEKQVSPLGERCGALANTLKESATAAGAAADGLHSVGRSLENASPALRSVR